MLFGNELDALQDTASDRVADVFASRIRVQIADCLSGSAQLESLARRTLTVDTSASRLHIGIDEASSERHGRQARRDRNGAERGEGAKLSSSMHRHMGCHLIVLLLLMLISRDVGTSIFAVVDPLASPSGLFGKFGDHSHSYTYAQEMDKSNVLVSYNLDLVDMSVSREVLAQFHLRQAVVQVAKTEECHVKLATCTGRSQDNQAY